MLRSVIEKVNNIHEQMGKVSRKVKTLSKNPRKMIEITNTVTK